MSPNPSRENQNYDAILNQMPVQERASLNLAKEQMSQAPAQGQTISNDELATLPVGSTPNQTGKNLVSKYGRESVANDIERQPSQEPDR